MNPWEVLGIGETHDERAIKRAYAKRLKLTRPEDDAHGFQELRDAYAFALRMAAYLRDQEAEGETVAAAPAAVPVAAPQPTPAPAPEADDVSPVGVAFFHDADYQPTAKAPDAREIAEALWARFLEAATIAPRYQLKEMAASEAMLALDVRDHVELYAVSYCATDACNDELREAIADHFEWASDMALVRRELPRQAAAAVERLRAAESYRQFLDHARSNPSTAALLADSPGRAFPQAWDRKFVFAMRGLLAAVRWHHREMLVHKLDETVVDTWARRVEKRWYFLQTAVWSIAAAIVLSGVAAFVLADFGLVERYGVASIVAAFVLTLSAGAGLEYLLARPKVSAWRERLLHEWRYLPAVQFGWIGALAALGLLLWIPDPPLLVKIAAAVIALGCLGVACIANSAVLNGFAFTLSILFGIGLAMGTGSAIDFVTYAAGASAALQLFYRGGSDLWAWLNTPDNWIMRMRAAWLAGVVLVMGLAAYTTTAPALLKLFAGAWILAGMLLSRPTIHLLAGVVGSVALRALASPVLKDAPSHDLVLDLMFMFMMAVLIFMAVNMRRATEHQHQFA